MLNCKAHYVDHGCHLRTVGGCLFQCDRKRKSSEDINHSK
jgi:hypothetical protein